MIATGIGRTVPKRTRKGGQPFFGRIIVIIGMILGAGDWFRDGGGRNHHGFQQYGFGNQLALLVANEGKPVSLSLDLQHTTADN
mmetsp:Transcript_33640/g.59075  ORF Transcript_33640/g.59075 Transcript_33640/m.59075 type:complete len:84 (-) Transcript_33640:121-372(-)